jgi:type I restriction enzyme S subunit
MVCELGNTVTGNTPPTTEKQYYGHDIPFVKPPQLINGPVSDSDDGLSGAGIEQSRVVAANSVLVSCIGNLGRTGLNKIPVAINQQINAITVARGIDPKFAFYQAQSPTFQTQLKKLSSATTIAIVNKGNFNRISLSIAPTAEQNRIVAKIEELFSELDKGVESLTTAREQLKVYRQAVLKHAFEGKLTADWRANNPVSERPRIFDRSRRTDEIVPEEIKELADIPGTWSYSRLGEFISDIKAGNSFKCDEREPQPGEIGVAKVSAVSWGEYNEAESKTCVDPSRVNTSLFIRPGDFLLSRANTIQLVGACVIAKRVSKSVMLSDKTLRIEFDSGNKHFFLYYLRSIMGRAEIEKRSTGNQESMRNIGQDRIKNIIVPICNDEEMAETVKRLEAQLSEIDHLEAELLQLSLRGESLRQSILTKAFSGQLVPQDPNDEPASVLLERIKAEKEATAITKQKPKKFKAQGAAV